MAETANGTSSEKLGKWIALGASIVGIFVTINTAVSGYLRERVVEAQTFRTQVANEEAYWSGLYDRLVKAVAEDNPASQERERKLTAIALLATHEPPDFAEYRSRFVSEQTITKTNDHLARLREVLVSALRDPRISSEETALAIGELLDTRSAVRPRAPVRAGQSTPPPVTDGAQAVAVAAQRTLPEIPVTTSSTAQARLGSQILATGATNGWDIDVFWCAGPDGAANVAFATKVANALAQSANSGKAVANGVSIGRVRLRSLSVEAQKSGGPFKPGPGIFYDGSPGEAAAAKAIAAFVKKQSDLTLETVTSTGAATQWYLSAFVCKA